MYFLGSQRVEENPPFFFKKKVMKILLQVEKSDLVFGGTPFQLWSWPATDLNTAIFFQAVTFPLGSPRQTHFGSLASDQTNHLSFYFCTWPLLSSAPSAFLPAPGAAPAIGPSAAIAAVSRQLSVN